jgi:hypothetical protein
MSLQEHASLSCRAIKMKFQKYPSTLKEIKLLLLVVIKLAEYGQLIQETRFKY